MNINKQLQRRISCKCGRVHTTNTKRIVIENNIRYKIVDLIKEVYPAGNIGIVSAEDISVTSEIVSSLNKAGFKTKKIIFKPFVVPLKEEAEKICDFDETIRFIIGIGSGSICDLVKYASNKMKIPCLFFATAPSTDSFLTPIVTFNNMEEIRVKGIDYFVYDPSIDCPRALIACGLGNLYLRMLSIFDWEYYNLISNNKFCKKYIVEMKEETKVMLNSNVKYTADYLSRLMNCLVNNSIKISYIYQKDLLMSADYMVNLIRFKHPNCAAAPIIASNLIYEFYNYWLNTENMKIMFPPDKNKYLEKKSIFGDNDFDGDIKTVDCIMQIRIDYITNRYKFKLFNNLKNMILNIDDMSSDVLEVFTDNGYHIKHLFKYKELIKYVGISAQMSKGYSLLKHIDNSGLICHYMDVI